MRRTPENASAAVARPSARRGGGLHYLFDGATVRAFAGDRQVAEDARPGAPLRTHARFLAVVNLDTLHLPRYRVGPLPPGELLAGGREGLAVVETDTGRRYRLRFSRPSPSAR